MTQRLKIKWPTITRRSLLVGLTEDYKDGTWHGFTNVREAVGLMAWLGELNQPLRPEYNNLIRPAKLSDR